MKNKAKTDNSPSSSFLPKRFQAAQDSYFSAECEVFKHFVGQGPCRLWFAQEPLCERWEHSQEPMWAGRLTCLQHLKI